MTFLELTQIFLKERTNYQLILDGLHTLHEFYASVTGVSAEQTTDGNIFLPTGKAISPGQAAHCLLDLKRTTGFLRGIERAILDLQQKFPDEPVNILYAGCGPYATLLTPLTTLFGPNQVRFYLMDVNEHSLKAVQTLYHHLGAQEYVAEYICADAAQYKMEKRMHLVISEAMQKALMKEPQLSIMLNLIPQMEESAIFIPYEIRVAAYLLDRDQEISNLLGEGPAPQRVKLGDVYTIGRNDVQPPQSVTFSIPSGIGSHDQVYLLTDISIYSDESLTINECGLTLPCWLYNVKSDQEKIRVEYVMDGDPRFVVSGL